MGEAIEYMELSEFYIGIDPSTVSTGYAILDGSGKLVQSGTINPPSEYGDASKLLYLHRELKSLMEFYGSAELGPEGYTRNNEIVAVGVEDQFNGPNVMTLIKIARTASVCMQLSASLCGDHGTHMFYPGSWRLLFHGSGKAKKADTIKLVNEMHGLSLKGKDNDIADAIGIAHATLRKCQGGCAKVKK